MISRARNAWIILMLLATSGFYLAFISRTIQYDEAYTLRHFAVNPAIALLSYTEPNNHMLHSLLVWITTTLAGQSLIAVRFPAFALALLSAAMIYRAGRKIGDWQGGIAASIFLVTNATFADYAVNARGYTLSVFLMLTLIDLVFLSQPKRTRRYRYGLLLTCCALILTLPTMVLLIAGVLAWLVWRSWQDGRYRGLFVPMIFGSVIGAIFYLPSALAGALSRNVGRFGYGDLGALASEWLNIMFGTPVIGYVLIILCIVGAILLGRQRKQRALLQLSASILGITLLEVVVQFTVMHHTFYGRNYFYLLPAICLIGAVGLSVIHSNWSLIVALAFIAVAGFVLPPMLGRETEVDQVLQRFDMLLQPGDMVLIGNFADEPIFYTLQAQDHWNRLLLMPEKDRLIIVTEQGDDKAALIATYRLDSYLRDCHPSDDPRWLPFAVDECSFIAR